MALVIIIISATVRLCGVNMSSPWKVCKCTLLCAGLQAQTRRRVCYATRVSRTLLIDTDTVMPIRLLEHRWRAAGIRPDRHGPEIYLVAQQLSRETRLRPASL